MAGAREERGKRQRRHHRDVEENRSRCRRGEALHHIEDAAVQRHQGDQQQVWKGDPRQLDRQRALLRIVGETRRQNAHHLRHERQRDGEQHQLRQKQQREDAVGEQLRRGLTLLAVDMRIGRHEGSVERALGEDRPEVIWQSQRDEERIRHRTGAEDRRQHDVAGKSGQTRQQGEAADGEDALEHEALLQEVATAQNRNGWLRSPHTGVIPGRARQGANPESRCGGSTLSATSRFRVRSLSRAPRNDGEAQCSTRTTVPYRPSAPRTAWMTRSCVGASR